MKKIDKGEYHYNDVRLIKSLDSDVKFIGLLKCVPNVNSENISKLLLSTDKNLENYQFVLDELKGNKELVLNHNKKAIKKYAHYYISGLDGFRDFCRYGNELAKEKSSFEKLINMNIILVKSGLLIPEEIIQIQEDFKSLSDYFLKKTAKGFSEHSFEKIGKPIIDQFVKALTVFNQNNNHNAKEEILRQLKSYSVRQKTLSEEIKDLIIQEEYSIAKLPQEAKEQVERITALVNNFRNDEVKVFFNERLPVILKKYFSIDEEYRTSLKNVEGYNAQELMSQSLENIERIIIAKKEDSNYDLVSELSVENRKLRMKIIK